MLPNYFIFFRGNRTLESLLMLSDTFHVVLVHYILIISINEANDAPLHLDKFADFRVMFVDFKSLGRGVNTEPKNEANVPQSPLPCWCVNGGG